MIISDYPNGKAYMTHLWEKPEYQKQVERQLQGIEDENIPLDFNDNHFHKMEDPRILIHIDNATDEEFAELRRLESKFNKLIVNVKMSIGGSHCGKREINEPQKVLF